MPTITYRKIGPNNDPLFGQGQTNFIADSDAVAQAIQTRLQLFLAEWWSDLQDGTPYWQTILGQGASERQQQAISLILQQRIEGTPYVVDLGNVQATFNPGTRAFSFYAEVKTQFGNLIVTNLPQPPNQGLPVIGLPSGQ